ncbi:MAG: glycoside hydrolase family 2 protein, partial [Myxococcales bacterium]|nr:glycoside hydrolase family 2 protein [Myxococcales bacterium]
MRMALEPPARAPARARAVRTWLIAATLCLTASWCGQPARPGPGVTPGAPSGPADSGGGGAEAAGGGGSAAAGDARAGGSVPGTGDGGGSSSTSGSGGGDAGSSGAAGNPGPGGGGASGSGDAGGSAGSASGAAAPPPGMPVYNGLRGQDFDGGWKFMRGDVTGAQSPTFDDSSWRSLDVPHDWSIELAFNASSAAGAGGGYLDGGVGWYRKTFSVDPAAAGQRIVVQFDGVYMNSQVWINGTSLGTRPYGYSSFEYDLTPYVNSGAGNVIAVRVNNNQPNSRWYSGSGIYRNVWLLTLQPVHVPSSGVSVSTSAVSAASATVNVSTEVVNQSAASASVTVTATVVDPAGATVTSIDSAATAVAAGATAVVGQTATVPAPRLWSVGAPSLYRLKVEVKTGGATVDTYVTPFGIRTATFDPAAGFALNGQTMKIRGVALHHDLGALGAAVNSRAIEREVQILQAMGVNAIRTAHNPPAPELLEITDRLGVLVLDEAFDTWEQTKTANDYGLYFKDWAQRDLQDMVRRDRNHPSVVLWSIGNEVGGSTTATAQNLKGWVLAMDATRPVTWASNKMGGPHVSEGADRAVAALLDVVGYNYAPYAGDYDADHAANPGWALLGTETTAAVRSRGVYHAPADTVTLATSQSSPDRQCSSYDNEATGFGATAENAYTYDNDRAFVAGSFVWTGFDYIGEPTPYSSFPSKSSYFGMVDTAGLPK